MASQLMQNLRSRWVFLTGLLLVLLYWFWIHPPGFGRIGYGEDLGGIEISRMMMADALKEFGAPRFFSGRVMAPTGTEVAFCSWSMERDWLGAYFWNWNKDFPFLWIYFGFSLLTCYLAVGLICRKMRLSRSSAWALATLVTLFHAPRHLKAFHHYEHLIEHWLYISVFLDAWIWQKAHRERKLSLNLELWRAFCLLGMLGIGGYYWGPLIIEWVLLRASLAILVLGRKRGGIPTEFEWSWKKAYLPSVLSLIWILLEVRWFLPLAEEVKKLGEVWQVLGWTAKPGMVLRPLWLERVESFLSFLSPQTAANFRVWLENIKLWPLEAPETVVTIGWTYWIPLILSFAWVRKKSQGPGFSILAPFAVFFLFQISYFIAGYPYPMQEAVRRIVPFMSFFRVVSRMGLFMPVTAGAMLALAWPELSGGLKQGKVAAKWVAVFVVIMGAEAFVIRTPFTAMPPMPKHMVNILEKVREEPGTTVLNMPFCVAGGNGICSGQQCPNYPLSVAPSYLSYWHEKKVYGIYLARMVPAQCELYNKSPYLSWFDAWAKQRCLSSTEFDELCSYLDEHSEISALFLFPNIWTGAGEPACMAEFERRFGPPKDHSSFYTNGTRGGKGERPTGLLWFESKCRKSSSYPTR